MKKENLKIFLGGGIIGLIGVLLVKFGNPGNMGICVACFWRDVAGGIGLHRADVVQYIRPEILGFIIGAFITSLFTKDFRVKGGSSSLTRFFLGFFMSIGALVFLGCPLRMIFRLANGDLNALVGLVGFVIGVTIGIQFRKKGYSLGRATKEAKVLGYIMPAVAVALLLMLVFKAGFIFNSKTGPGSMHAPVAISLAAGLIVGGILQRTRICTAGAFRDVILIKDMHFMWGVIGVFVFALVGNLALNFQGFNLGFANQPVAHTNHLWNFLGMVLVGFAGILAGGCPIRQTILSGQGDTDAGITVMGIILGAAMAHNFNLASSPKGPTFNGQIAVVIGIVVCVVIGYSVIKFNEER